MLAVRLCALAVASVLVAGGCGSDDGNPLAGNSDSLEVTRQDGSHVQFWPMQAACFSEEGERRLVVQTFQNPDEGVRRGHLTFSRPTEEISRTPKLTFPESEGSETALFIMDPETGYDLASSEHNSSGQLVVEKWGCETGDTVRVRVDAKLESYMHDEESLTPVQGEIVAVIGD
jgi:hypothetical protein